MTTATIDRLQTAADALVWARAETAERVPASEAAATATVHLDRAIRSTRRAAARLAQLEFAGAESEREAS